MCASVRETEEGVTERNWHSEAGWHHESAIHQKPPYEILCFSLSSLVQIPLSWEECRRTRLHISHVHIFVCFFERVFDCLVFLLVFLAAALALCKYSLAEWNATDESANRTVSHCHRHGNRDNCTGRYGQVARGGSLFAVSCCFEVLRWRINMRMDKSTDMDVNEIQTHLSTETLDRKGNKMRKDRNRCS